MDKTWLTIKWSCWLAVGVAFLFWAKALSLRYNAWTTSLRERYPNINLAPTPEWRKRNTAIMMWMFRVFGAFLLALSTLALLGIHASR